MWLSHEDWRTTSFQLCLLCQRVELLIQRRLATPTAQTHVQNVQYMATRFVSRAEPRSPGAFEGTHYCLALLTWLGLDISWYMPQDNTSATRDLKLPRGIVHLQMQLHTVYAYLTWPIYFTFKKKKYIGRFVSVIQAFKSAACCSILIFLGHAE